MLKTNITRAAKGNLYYARFELCKNDVKKTRATINDIIKRDNKVEISECFLWDGEFSNDGNNIAEEFNSFFRISHLSQSWKWKALLT